MRDVPADTPVATPVVVLIVAIAGLLLLQVPPKVVLDSVVTAPTQKLIAPVMAAGREFTVTTTTLTQAVLNS